MARTGLGKGLGALISTRPLQTQPGLDVDAPEKERIHEVSLASIVPSPLQPRKNFAREALEELIDSIRQHGIIQPLIVRQTNGRLELIAGERRWRAAQEAGLSQVPVIIRRASDLEVLELSLIENLQRSDLNPIEEAQGYARLAGEFGMRQEDIAAKVARSRAAVANAMRLLDLHPQIQTWIAQNLISVGHAKVLLGLKSHEEQLVTAETVLRRQVRSTGACDQDHQHEPPRALWPRAGPQVHGPDLRRAVGDRIPGVRDRDPRPARADRRRGAAGGLELHHSRSQRRLPCRCP